MINDLLVTSDREEARKAKQDTLTGKGSERRERERETTRLDIDPCVDGVGLSFSWLALFSLLSSLFLFFFFSFHTRQVDPFFGATVFSLLPVRERAKN